MKKIILALAVIAVMGNSSIQATVAPAVQTPITVVAEVPETLDGKITRYARKYGINEARFRALILCEDRTMNPSKQSDLHYQFSDPRRGIVEGERERSYGLVQIHLPDHPEVSYVQAIDPDFSLNWAAQKISTGWTLWSCWK